MLLSGLVHGGYDRVMNTKLRALPVSERIRLVGELWDSIAADGESLPLTAAQAAELDSRLKAFENDKSPGRPAAEVIAEIRKRL
jgi:putative addiction module component (TIGR02574 family)